MLLTRFGLPFDNFVPREHYQTFEESENGLLVQPGGCYTELG